MNGFNTLQWTGTFGEDLMSSFEISSAIKAEATEIHALAALLPKDRSEWAHRIADRLWEQAKKLEERPEIFSVGEHAA